MKMRYSILIAIIVVFFSFLNNTDNINYADIKPLNVKDLKKEVIETQPINVIDKIILDKISLSAKIKSFMLINTESSVLKKYDKEDTYVIENNVMSQDCINIMGHQIPIGNKAFVDTKENKGVVYTDYYNNIIIPFDLDGIIVYSNKEQKILGGILRFKTLFFDRFMDIKNSKFFFITWMPSLDSPYPAYAYYQFYIVDMINKTMKIFDSYALGIFTSGFDTMERYAPRYDISYGRRYVYMTGIDMSDWAKKENYVTKEVFDKEPVKINTGLYVWDWWENRLFKLSDKNVTRVVNHEDGYVYIEETYSDKKGKTKYNYYRFPNPEAMLNEMGK